MRRLSILTAAVLLLALAFAVADAALAVPHMKPTVKKATRNGKEVSATDVKLPVPPRYMWGWGDGLRGYCGSFSFQSFGLLFGNYISAEPMRNAADGRELLIGVNEEIAANNMRFSFESWKWAKENVPQSSGFLAWIADHIDAGHGVVAGMFEQKNGGDEDYDHIMPVFGYLRDDSAAAAAAKGKGKDRSDVLGIYFNDLYRNHSLFGDAANGNFVRRRKDCDAPGGIQPLAAPYEFCLPENYDYGIALKGNRDDNGETFPSRLEMPSWTEPDYGFEDQIHAPVTTFAPRLIISGLTKGKSYTVLRFDHPLSVPVSDFARGAYSKRFDFVADADTVEMEGFDSFQSDATVFYRTIATPPAPLPRK